jgi:AcrR family transcriptional regulator
MDSRATAPAESRTRWGDRVGRRRDILRAASELLEREGYESFNVRSIARGAGVSAATLYSYFPTKNEIFAALMIQRFSDLRISLDSLDTSDGSATGSIEELLTRVMPELIDLYRHFGRHIHLWTQAEDESGSTVIAAKRAFIEATQALELVVRKAATNEGAELDEDALLMPYIWSALFGIAFQHSNNMTGTLGYSREELTRYAARSVARGLVISRVPSTQKS